MPIVPSPKVQAQATTVPSGSVLPVPSKVTEVLTVAVDGEAMTATGGLSLIVSDALAEPVDPLLSVAVTVIVKFSESALPVFAYECVADVALPARLVEVPSPHMTMIDDTVPSGSVAVKVTVTVWPVRAGFGVGAVTVTTGGLSLTISVAAADPVKPPLSVAVTATVKLMLIEDPVEA